MIAELYPIRDCPVGRLAIMPRPRAGDWLEDEAASWRRQQIDTAVSLLEDDEIAELGLSEEAAACVKAGLRFVRLPVPDRGVPASELAVSALIAILIDELRQSRGIAIHCRIGVGRSASLAVCVLVTLGIPIDSAWSMVEQSRGLSVPDTPTQKEWVTTFFTAKVAE